MKDRIHGDLVRISRVKKDSQSTLYVKDLTEVPQKQVQFCENECIMFGPGNRNAFSRKFFASMTPSYIRTCYKEVEKEVMRSHNSGDVWIETGEGNKESFVGFI